jgi:hypothetical protein
VIEDGLQVAIDLTTLPPPPTSLTSLLVATSGVELVPCAPASLRDRFASAVHELLVPSAHAHLLDTDVRLGTAVVEDLLAAAPFAYGRLSPPPGTYCGVRYWFVAADEDALHIDAYPHALGHVLVWTAGARSDVTHTLARTFDRVLPFPQGEVTLRPAERWTLELTRDPSGAVDILGVDPDSATAGPRALIALADGLAVTLRGPL